MREGARERVSAHDVGEREPRGHRSAAQHAAPMHLLRWYDRDAARSGPVARLEPFPWPRLGRMRADLRRLYLKVDRSPASAEIRHAEKMIVAVRRCIRRSWCGVRDETRLLISQKLSDLWLGAWKLWELRLTGRDGIARALYVTAIGRRMVVVRAFVKKTQKRPHAPRSSSRYSEQRR